MIIDIKPIVLLKGEISPAGGGMADGVVAGNIEYRMLNVQL
jgi:hypothetical protein